jgi:tRNA pseudouridine55 synthase
VEEHLFPADRALQDYPALLLDATTAERVLHGNAFRYDHYNRDLPTSTDLARVYDTGGHFLAIAEWDTAQQVWKPKKVLAR